MKIDEDIPACEPDIERGLRNVPEINFFSLIVYVFYRYFGKECATKLKMLLEEMLKVGVVLKLFPIYRRKLMKSLKQQTKSKNMKPWLVSQIHKIINTKKKLNMNHYMMNKICLMKK